jgi:hypothetical protein
MRLLIAVSLPILLLAGLCAWAILQGVATLLGVGLVVLWVAGFAWLLALAGAHMVYEVSDSAGTVLDALLTTAPAALLAALVFPFVPSQETQVLVLVGLGLGVSMVGHALGIGFFDHSLGHKAIAWLRPVHPGFADDQLATMVAASFVAAGVESIGLSIYTNPANGSVALGCVGQATEAQHAVAARVARRLARMKRLHGYPDSWVAGHQVPAQALTAHQRLHLHTVAHA